MLLATRLRLGGSFTDPVTYTLTSAQDGGWTHASDPHAVYSAGKTFFGYVDGSNGNIEVRSWDHTTHTASASFSLHAALQVDSHAAPSLIVRPDGRLVAAYSAHDGATIYVRRSTNVADISAWQTEQDLDATLGGVDYTYPHLHYVGTTLYLFYRDFQGGTTGVLCYSTSTDDGVTWSAQTQLYKSAGKSSYWKIDSDGSRIDIATTDGRDPPDSPPTKFYHFYIEGGTRKKSDGTTISTSLPIGPSDLTEVYNGGDGVGWPQDIVTSGANPVLVYAVLDAPTTNSWRYARWNGATWAKTAIASSAGTIESGFASHIVLDHAAANIAYAPTVVGSRWEMFRYISLDNGASWSGVALTHGSAADHLLPTAIRNHPSDMTVLWLYGTYTSYLVFSFGILGR
jgi:hypothetical protein